MQAKPVHMELCMSNDEMRPGLTCHVEIECGDIATATWALRDLATQIEADKLDSGFDPIKGQSGEKIGEAYLDHYATGPR
jgi:hypothetical protein